MKILCTVKRVTDYEAKIRLKSDGSDIETDGVNMIMNPFDEIGVEEALKIKESKGGEVVVMSIGSDDSIQQIRSAMAMGADRGILVRAEADMDSNTIAKIIGKVVTEESPDLVLMGKQAIDGDSNQAAQMLAENLGWGQATYAYKVKIEGEEATVTREADGGLETIAVKLPAVITTDLRLNEPRYASLPGIMKAKRKPLATKTLDELGVTPTNYVVMKGLEEPPAKAAGQILPDIATLVEKLKSEAKVL